MPAPTVQLSTASFTVCGTGIVRMWPRFPLRSAMTHFFYTQRPEDRVLAALVRKTKTIREELGSLSQVIDSKLDGLMKNGIRRADVDDLKNQIDSADLEGGQRETIEEELEATREREVELRAQIERLSTMLARSQESLSFSTDHFRSALSCSLEVMGADPLKPAPNGKNPRRSVFPALDQRPGADPSWAETMDSLRAPRPRDQKFWEWRRTSSIRPVVFEDPGVKESGLHCGREDSQRYACWRCFVWPRDR